MVGSAGASTESRSTAMAVALGLSLALYVGLNVWFYVYDGFFRYWNYPL
jgi:hypothetical protein